MSENTAPEVSTETAPTPAPEAPASNPAPETPKESSPQLDLPLGDAAKVETTPAAYTPNYKLKVAGEEREIPEEFRALMKDETSGKKIKEIFEKSYGLDYTKPKYETLKTDYAKVTADHHALNGAINEIKQLYAKGDMDTFFEKLGIPQEKVLQYAVDKVKYSELPDEQRAALDAKRNVEKENYSLQNQFNDLQKNFQEQLVQQRHMLLESELARSEVKSVADMVNERVGRPDAFIQAVYAHGDLTWKNSQGKVDLTPRQAVDAVVEGYRKLFGTANPATNPNTPVSVKPNATIIPNVGSGKSSSPVKQKPRSIEDLKKLREQALG